MRECTCKTKYASELSRLEVLTDHIEFAERQLKRGSVYTHGWADLEKWNKDIAELRGMLPKCAVEDFDNERKKNLHRPNCQCLLCQE